VTTLPLYFAAYEAEIGQAMDRATMYSAAAANRGNHALIPTMNYVERLPDISAPTLILSRVDDWITPPAQAGERLGAGIPNSTLVVFGRSGHFAFIEQSDDYLATVGAWLDRLHG